MALWTPAEIQTELWLDAADAATITASSGLVSQWADKSGNGRHVGQASNSYKPELIAGGLNGLDVLRFTPNDHIYLGSHGIGRNASEIFIIAVRRWTTQPSAATQFLAASRFALLASGSTGTRGAYVRRADTGTIAFTSDATPVGTSFATHAVAADFGSANTSSLIVNGAVISTAAIDGSGPTADADQGIFMLGGNVASAATPSNATFRGEIAEIVIVHGLEHVDKIVGYMHHRWGLAALLPADHPYKSAAPTTGGGTVTAQISLPDPLDDAHPALTAAVPAAARASIPDPLDEATPAVLAEVVSATVTAALSLPDPLDESVPTLTATQARQARASLPDPLDESTPALRGNVPTVAAVSLPDPLDEAQILLDTLVTRYELRGEVRNSGVLVERHVRAHRRDTGAVLAEGPTYLGRYLLHAGFAPVECYVLALDLDEAATDYAPPIANRVVPELAQDWT